LTDRETRDALESILRELLPEDYQDPAFPVSPAPMRSAGLKFDESGRVQWDQIWRSFCDLAMAGGPPHKGRLLEPGRPADIQTNPEPHAAVVHEICRGIAMTTGLEAQASPAAGWVRVRSRDETMAGWLLRAIVMENVAVRARDVFLDLPAAPHFSLDREIKNVVTVMAKTCHYWTDHMSDEQHDTIRALLSALDRSSPLIAPDDGWHGVECGDVTEAIWLMRMLVAGNILARREETTLFVPVNTAADPDGEVVRSSLARLRSLSHT